MGRRVGCAILAAAAAGLAACSADPELSVDLVTDLAPGVEFVSVRSETLGPPLVAGGAPSVHERIDVTAFVPADYLHGRRVAEFGARAPGSFTLRVSLLDVRERVVAERIVLIHFTASLAVTVTVSRDCRDVTCPGPSDDPALVSCGGGRCVEPTCVTGEEPTCVAECHVDTDCPGAASCAAARCIAGVCLYERRDDRCTSAERCDVDLGCVDALGADAGAQDAGAQDAGAQDAGVDASARADASALPDAARPDAAAPIDAGPPPVDAGCAGVCTAGATGRETRACGMCGTQSRTRTCGSSCAWGAWSAWSGCSGEHGSCLPGATSSFSRACGACGMQSCSQTCTSSCAWGTATCAACVDPPHCTDAFGATVCPGSAGVRDCSTMGPGCVRPCTCSAGGAWISCAAGCACP